MRMSVAHRRILIFSCLLSAVACDSGVRPDGGDAADSLRQGGDHGVEAQEMADAGRGARELTDHPPIGYGPDPILPPPDTTQRAAKFAKIVGWRDGHTPTAPEGFAVELFAGGLQHPRWLCVLPNGDVLVAESNNPGSAPDSLMSPEQWAKRVAAGSLGPSANRITLLRDGDGDGKPESREVFLSGLNQPFGMALVGSWLYVTTTDALLRFRYEQGQLRITSAGEKILELPAGRYNSHWTRNVLPNRDGSKLYVTVGSATNVDVEGIDAKDPRRAAILEVNPDGSGMRVFASGLRNPTGLAWAPGTDVLWAAVNERDDLGEDLVPDYVTSVREGAFYGWPYAYFGPHEDPRQAGRRPDLVAKAIAPDYATGAHTATLAIVFYEHDAFPERYRNGAFISQHGSLNRSHFAGYRVLFLPFAGGRPKGAVEDFLTGFAPSDGGSDVHGRPAGLAILPDGSLLVADDAANRIWRVRPT
jgi:glucose/arabinose dehydrogenase